MPGSIPKSVHPLIGAFHDEIDGLYRYALSLIGNRSDAEDAVQDAFVRVARLPGHASEIEQPRAWFFRIVRNICIDRLRSSRTRRDYLEQHSESQITQREQISVQTPEHSFLIRNTLSAVDQAIQQLPAGQAQIVMLVLVEGLSYQETSEITGCSVAAVRNKLFRARQLLRKQLEGLAGLQGNCPSQAGEGE